MLSMEERVPRLLLLFVPRTPFFFCEQSFGILKTQRLWKFRPQYSHFRPFVEVCHAFVLLADTQTCLNIPKSISPQKLQKVGVL